jgi:hypothetical protein
MAAQTEGRLYNKNGQKYISDPIRRQIELYSSPSSGSWEAGVNYPETVADSRFFTDNIFKHIIID